MRGIDLAYESVGKCPLCGGRGQEKAVLRRQFYTFGPFEIALPPGGVGLLACERCKLLYKSAVPEVAGFARVMKAAAARVWRPKKGVHPAVALIRRFLPPGRVDILDIGASHGDLLAQFANVAGRLSALDITRFPRCSDIVTGEYIVGEVEKPLEWSGVRYGLVTAFDVFEHFRDAGHAIDNILNMTTVGGVIVIETGDWTTAAAHLDKWYYTNLFEHHVFWCRDTFEYLCQSRSCRLVACERVEHKGRRVMPAAKRAVLAVATNVAHIPGGAAFVRFVTGYDPTLLGPPGLLDHAFVVLSPFAVNHESESSRANA